MAEQKENLMNQKLNLAEKRIIEFFSDKKLKRPRPCYMP